MKEYTTLSEELAKLSPERQERIKARTSRLYLEELIFNRKVMIKFNAFYLCILMNHKGTKNTKD